MNPHYDLATEDYVPKVFRNTSSSWWCTNTLKFGYKRLISSEDIFWTKWDRQRDRLCYTPTPTLLWGIQNPIQSEAVIQQQEQCVFEVPEFRQWAFVWRTIIHVIVAFLELCQKLYLLLGIRQGILQHEGHKIKWPTGHLHYNVHSYQAVKYLCPAACVSLCIVTRQQKASRFCGVGLCLRSKSCHVMLLAFGAATSNVCGKDRSWPKSCCVRYWCSPSPVQTNGQHGFSQWQLTCTRQ